MEQKRIYLEYLIDVAKVPNFMADIPTDGLVDVQVIRVDTTSPVSTTSSALPASPFSATP